VQPFREIAGLAVLPIIALLLSIASFPAFGFRPELLPLAFFTLFSSIGSIPRLSDMAHKLRTDNYDGRWVFSLIKLMILLSVALFALLFLPKVEPVGWIAERTERDDTQVIITRTIELTDDVRKVEWNVNAYHSRRNIIEDSNFKTTKSRMPIVLVACPILGSLAFYEEYCTSLASEGFLVVAFARKINFNSGKLFGAYWDVIFSSLFSGRTIEADRVASRMEQDLVSDFSYLLQWLKSDIGTNKLEYPGLDSAPLSVAGFGSGGAAALMYGVQSEEYSDLVACISVEGVPASFRQTEIRMGDIKNKHTRSASVGRKVFLVIKENLLAVKRKIGFDGYLFVGKVPESAVPNLMVVSDKIGDTDNRDGRYAVLLRFLRVAKAMSALVSFEGAGFLDFTDAPRKYPVFSVFNRGLKPRVEWAKSSYANEAAYASAAFIVSAINKRQMTNGNLDEKDSGPSGFSNEPSWVKFSSRNDISIELGGEW